MASAVVSREWLTDTLDLIYQFSEYQVHLYTNDYAPTVDSVTADFVEADYDTYPSGGIGGNPTPNLNVGNQVQTTAVAAVFPAPTSDGPVTIYGFYVTYSAPFGGGAHKVLLSAKFATSVELENGGAALPIIISSNALDYNNP